MQGCHGLISWWMSVSQQLNQIQLICFNSVTVTTFWFTELVSIGSKVAEEAVAPGPVKISHKKMAAFGGHIDFMFLSPSYQLMDPLLLVHVSLKSTLRLSLLFSELCSLNSIVNSVMYKAFYRAPAKSVFKRLLAFCDRYSLVVWWPPYGALSLVV